MVRGDPKTQERLGPLLFYGIVITVGYLAYRILEPFIVPFAWAAVLVVVAYPLFGHLETRIGPTRAALASTAAVTLILIAPTLGALYAFAQEGVGAVHILQRNAANGKFDWVNHAWENVQRRFPQIGAADLPDTLRQWGEAAAEYGVAKIGTILAHAATFVFDLVVTIFVMFYLFHDGKTMVSRLQALLPFPQEQSESMLQETEDLIFASILSTGASALAQGVLGGLAFAIAGISEPIFWGVMIAFLSLIPVVGSALVWVPAAITLMSAAHMTRGIVLLAFYGLVIAFCDYVLRPWLISGRAKMGGLVIFISVLGGVEYFGLLGIVLGPIVIALLASLLDFYVAPSRHGNKIAKAHGN
jgi:predicted PurR-regulated permease PerM